MHGRAEKSLKGFGGKARRKETTWKTKGDGIRMDLREIGWAGRVWIGFYWLRTGTCGGLL
jgi:hypothetical protein